MKLKRNTLNLISILLTLVMLISNITVFGAEQTDADKGDGSYDSSGGSSEGCNWDGTSQFLRISLFRAPRGEGVEGVKAIDWNSNEVTQVGKTIDITVDNPGDVVYHTNFKNARAHYQDNYKKAIDDNQYKTDQLYIGNISEVSAFPKPINNKQGDAEYLKNYFAEEEVLNNILWILSNNGNIQGVTVDGLNGGYFTNEHNEVIPTAYALIIEPGIYATVNNKKSAYTLRDTIGWWKSGTISPLSYNPSSCYAIARGLTLQDPSTLQYDINFGSIGLSRNIGESVDLGELEGSDVRSYAVSGKSNNIMRRAMGVGTITYWGNEEPIIDIETLPIIKYYYDFAEQDSEEDDESQVNEMLTNIAVFNDANYVNIEKINKKKYSASMRDLPDELTYGAYKNPESGEAEDNLYKLSNILILNTNQQGDTDSNIIFEQNNKYNTMEATGKSALGGYVDIDTDGRVKFFATDANGEIINSEEGYWLTSNAGSRILRYADIEAWENVTGSSSLPDDRTIGDSAINNGIAGLARMYLWSLGFNTDETQEKFVDIERKNNVNNIIAIEAMAADQQVLETEHTMRLSNIIAAWKDNVEFNMNQFESTGSQLVLLYTRNEPTLSTPSPTPGDTPTPPPPGIKVMSTNINTYFYDSINSEAPINIASEELAILDLEGSVSKYTIQPEIMAGDDKYTLVDWVTLEDENPEGPDLLPTWTDVLEHIDTGYEQHGDTAGDWIDWTNPDRELNIRYVLATDDLQYPASVVIPQNKITRAVSVRDITANKPNVKFNWLQVSGSDSHRHNKHSHSCSKVINDGSLTLLASCLNEETFTGSNIIASVKDFKGFDENNTYSTTRTKSSGSKTMYSYDYNYVIWRGLDIPVLADYKYKGINSTNYSIINSLINRNAL